MPSSATLGCALRTGIAAGALLAGLVASGCAPKRAIPPAPIDPAVLLERAHAQLAAGCFDCLDEAHRQYLALRDNPSVGARATAGAVRSAVLLFMRENELGLFDSGYLKSARQLIEASPALTPALTPIADLADAVTAGPGAGPLRQSLEARSLALVALSGNQLRWAELLRSTMPGDPAASYLWLSMACGIYGSAIPGSTDRGSAVGDDIRTPLVSFRDAISCNRNRRGALQTVLDAEPRFKEAHYFQGLAALAGQPKPGEAGGAPDLEDADEHFRAAYEWRHDWPSLTLSIAALALTFEDFERSYEFYDRTLMLIPENPDAMLGRIRALTYLARHTEAIAAADEMLGAGINPGEARFWRALNEEQLNDHEAAWVDIELADKLLANGDVPKLAGIIAINRRQMEVARDKLELALKRRASPCETNYYLQLALADLREWPRVAAVASDCAACFDKDEAAIRREIEAFRASKIPEARRKRQIARREQQIGLNARMRAVAWFNAAAANYNLGRRDQARTFALKLTDDGQFGDRAKDLLSRLP